MFSQDTAASNVASPSPEGCAFPQKFLKSKSQICLFVKTCTSAMFLLKKQMEKCYKCSLVNHCLTRKSGLFSKEYNNYIFLKALLNFFEDNLPAVETCRGFFPPTSMATGRGVISSSCRGWLWDSQEGKPSEWVTIQRESTKTGVME